MKLAGYLRVSTEGQVDAFGKDIQRDGIQKTADLLGHTISEWFEEDAVSGKVEGAARPVMAEVVARASEFDGIIAFDPSRYARRYVVQETLYGVLWAAGLTVFTSTAGEVEQDEDPTRILIRQVLGVVAEFDHRQTVKKLHDGRTAKMRQGGYGGGGTKFGEKVDGSGKRAVFVRDQDEVRVMWKIRRWRRDGYSLADIAARLNEENVPTKTGKGVWHAQQVSRIVKSPENQ